MKDMERLATLLHERNRIEVEIAEITNRPCQLGHIGEYVASRVFGIRLADSAAEKGIDGFFCEGQLAGRSVNVKWYSKLEGLLDINPKALPDYYLVFAGPRSAAASSKGKVRPWVIEAVFLFEAHPLVEAIRARGSKVGVATSIPKAFWTGAEVFPRSGAHLSVTEWQRNVLALFGPDAHPA